MPDFSFEDKLEGTVCGVDEVGRGPLAGPVVAAAIIIPADIRSMDFIEALTDSKKLSEKKREELSLLIHEHCHASITELPPKDIDRINIFQASLEAMKHAVETLGHTPSHALIDGRHIPQDLPCPATPIIKGDLKSKSIAAASIIAKVHRDKIMKSLAELYPYFGWERNAGYPTQEHLAGIDRHGVTEFHRLSFAPVRNYLEFGRTNPQAAFAV